MPLCPQITNTPITVTQTADFTVSSVVPAVADTADGLTKNIDTIQTTADNAATTAGTAQSTANTALANAATAYSAAIGSLQPSANTIVNASNQITAINGNGITVYSGASATTGARVVLNSAGLAAFNSSGNATFSLTASTGAAVFSGSVTGASITASTMNIGGNAIIDASGLLTATGATITGTINATAGYFGTVSNGFSISSVGLTGVGSGAITGGTIQTSSGSTAIILNGSSNALQFKVSGSVSGNIVPLGVAGILMHYGASPDPSGSTYPKVQMSFSTALLAGSTSYALQSTTSGNASIGDFRMFNNAQVDGSATFNGTMFAPNLSTSTSATNLRVATGTIGEIQETSASSIRFKENIVDLNTVFDINPKKLLDLPVRAFTYKQGYVSANDDRVDLMLPGFIAEEVDAIYPIAADYGQDGPHSWNERFIIPGLLALIQDLYKEVQTLKGE